MYRRIGVRCSLFITLIVVQVYLGEDDVYPCDNIAYNVSVSVSVQDSSVLPNKHENCINAHLM